MRQLRAFDPAGQVPQQPDPHQAQHQHIQHTRAQNSQHKRRRFRAANILKYPKKDARPEEQRCAAERRYAEPAQRFACKPAAAAQDAQVDRECDGVGQQHGEQIAVDAKPRAGAPAVQQKELAQLRADRGHHVDMLQPECIEQAARGHLVIADDCDRPQQGHIFRGQRLAEEQLAQTRCERDEHRRCRDADQPDRRNRPPDESPHPLAAADRLCRRDRGQQRGADRADQRNRQKQERHRHAGDHAERGQRLFVGQSGYHQALRQQDRTRRADDVPNQRRCGQRQGNEKELPCRCPVKRRGQRGMRHAAPEQARQEQCAEHLADHHAGENQHGDRAVVLALIAVQQYPDGKNPDELLPDLGGGGVLHLLQSDEQRFEDILHAGQRKAQQDKRERLGAAPVAQQRDGDPVAEQQHHCGAGSAQGKKHRKRQPQDGADPAPLPSGFACCAQAGACHRYAGQASGVQHQIRRVDQPVHAQPLRACKITEQDAVKEAERLQRQIAAGEHPGRI